MASLKWFFFESTLALGGCLAVVLFLLLVHWRRTLKPRALLIGLALTIILLIVQAAVVTRREHADRIMKQIEIDLVASRPDALAAALSDRFHIAETNWDRAQFTDVVKRYLSWIDIVTLTRRALEVESSEQDRFETYVSYLADVSTADFRYVGLSRWLIEFVREDDDWRIQSIMPVSIDRTPTGGWKGVPRP